MNNLVILFRYFLLLFLLAGWPLKEVYCQCMDHQITHTSGTQQYGCTFVTVTSTGSVSVLTPSPCFYGPYWVGRLGPGSYIFEFNPPITGVTIDVQTLDNDGGNTDEMVVSVNGAFYPITNPGTPDGCMDPAVIFPPGTVRGQPGLDGSWQGININETISVLEIHDNWVSGSPIGFFINLNICCINCPTDAGEITANPLDLCPNDLATVPVAEQTFLQSDDILQYILFSNPNDPTNSIVSTNNTPQFSFDPATMSLGTTYYIAAVAGNDLGGNVDLNDPCLDLSNFIEVIWHAIPTVVFSYATSEVCADNCYDIQANFTGTPPFQLMGQVIAGGNVITTFNENYFGNAGLLTICLPANTPLGDLEIEATELTDNICTCN